MTLSFLFPTDGNECRETERLGRERLGGGHDSFPRFPPPRRARARARLHPHPRGAGVSIMNDAVLDIFAFLKSGRQEDFIATTNAKQKHPRNIRNTSGTQMALPRFVLRLFSLDVGWASIASFTRLSTFPCNCDKNSYCDKNCPKALKHDQITSVKRSPDVGFTQPFDRMTAVDITI